MYGVAVSLIFFLSPSDLDTFYRGESLYLTIVLNFHNAGEFLEIPFYFWHMDDKEVKSTEILHYVVQMSGFLCRKFHRQAENKL
jgi:hypothetical protein